MSVQQGSDDFKIYSSTGREIQDGEEFYIGLFEEYGSIRTSDGLIGGDYTYEHGHMYTLETIEGIRYIRAIHENTYLAGSECSGYQTTFSEELPEREFRLRIVQDKRFKSIMTLEKWDDGRGFTIDWVKASCGIICLDGGSAFRFQFKLP